MGLEYLLEDDRWKAVGSGFEKINAFLESIDLSQFKIAVERRKGLTKRLEELDASQRATAKALGVGVGTVNEDLRGRVRKRTEEAEIPAQDDGSMFESEQPSPLSLSGEEAGKAVEKRTAIKNAPKADPVETPPPPPGKFRVWYADPPWMYSTPQHGKQEQATTVGTHYPSMATSDICDMPVAEHTTDDAVLFLWTSCPRGREGCRDGHSRVFYHGQAKTLANP